MTIGVGPELAEVVVGPPPQVRWATASEEISKEDLHPGGPDDGSVSMKNIFNRAREGLGLGYIASHDDIQVGARYEETDPTHTSFC